MSEPPGSVEPPLQRTISPVSGRLAPARWGRVVILAAVVIGCGVLLLTSWRGDQAQPPPPADQPARQVVTFEPAAPTLTAPGAGAPSLSPTPQTLVPAPTAQAPTADPEPKAPNAPLIAFRQGGAGGAGATAAASPASASEVSRPTELESLRHASAISLVRARRLPDRDFLILAGSTLPCVLQTAMSSATPGYVSCLIPRDVLSDSGRVILLEKGTRVMGEYRANLRQGQKRIFVLWTRAVTPTGVAIALNAPAADALGRAGFDGRIDTHFWTRFGAGLLLSAVDNGASSLTGPDGASTTRLPSDAAGIAVQASVDVSPTLTKPQGGEVAIFVAQDLDFSSVYGLAEAP